MAEARSVSVVLKADIQDYVTKMDKASKATKDFASQTGKVSGSASTSTKNLGTAAKSASTDLDKAAKSAKGFGDAAGKAAVDADKAAKSTKSVGDSAGTIGIGLAAAGAAIAVGVGAAVKAFADFDKEMSNVRAVSGATAGEMLQLKDAALDAGAATKYSASQAAEAEAELVKAGISVKDVLGGALDGALSLAAAGNLDLANAATVSANAMNIFSLEGKDVAHIADVLASGANKSAADVDQLGQALQQSGLVAAQMGLSLEDTTGVLAAFADNGLKGSDAGTSLKTMLQRLVPSSVAAATAMEDIGFSAYDAQGNLKSIEAVAQNLQESLGGLTQKQKDATLATIFGSDAVRGANVLFKLGAKGVNDYTAAVNDQGAAARVAAVQMDNLAGDMENLRGSIETALIQGGSGANASLRGLAQTATDAVNAFGELPDAVQENVVKVAALTAGVLLLGGGLITVIPKIVATKEAIDALTAASPKLAGALGAVGKAAGVVGIAAASVEIKNMAAAATVAQPPVDQLAQGLRDIANNAEESRDFGTIFAKGMGIFRNDMEGANDALNNFGANANAALNATWYETLFGATGEAESVFSTRIRQIDAALVKLVQGGHADEAAKAADRIANSITQFGGDADQVRSQLTGYQAALDGASIANGEYADSTQAFTQAQAGAQGKGKLLSDEIDEQRKSAEAAEGAFRDLTDAVKNYGDQVAAALSATSGYEAAIDKAAEVAAKRKELQDQIAALQKGQDTADPKVAAAAAKAKAEVDAANKKADITDATTRRNADAAAAKAKTQAEKDRIRANEQAALDKSNIDRQQRAAKLAETQGKSGGAASDNADQIARLKEQLQQYTATLDLGTAAGRANNAMLLDIAETAKNAAVENFKNGDSVADVQKKMEGSRDAFIRQAQDFGASKDAATRMADALGLTKANLDNLATAADVKKTVTADTATADANLHSITRQLELIDGTTANAKVAIAYERVGPSAEAIAGLADGSLGFKGFADGGYTGAGGKYEPKGVVHGGEYVFTKEETSKAGVVNLAALARSLRGYETGGFVGSRFADRGLVSSAMSSSTVNSGGNVTNDRRINIENVNAADFASFEREADRRSRLHALGRRGAR